MPAGPPSGARSTRDDLLTAAIETFADKGYDGASIRMITDKIGVDAALVRHYFGDKAGLFTAAALGRIEIVEVLMQAVDGDPDTLGHRIVRAYLGLWESPDTAMVMRALLRSTMDSEPVRKRVEEAMQQALEHHRHSLPIRDETRIALVGTHLIGMAMTRYIVRFAPLASLTLEQVAEEMGPIIHRLLTESE